MNHVIDPRPALELVALEVAVLELLDELGGSVSIVELAYQLRHRHGDGVQVRELDLIDALWELERDGNIQPTHWRLSPP